MHTHSFIANNIDDLAIALSQHINEHFKPTLALVFASVTHDLQAIRQLISHYGISLIGCTTAGEIIDGQLYEQHIAIMLFDLPRDTFEPFAYSYEQQDGNHIADQLADLARSRFEHSGVLLLSGGHYHPEPLVAGIKERLGSEVRLFGGLAGDDLQMKEQLVFNNALVESRSVVGILLDANRIEMYGMAFSGWETLGVQHTITQATENIVYEIDNEPALDVFIKYFGYYGEMRDDRDIATAQYPLQIMRSDGYSVLRSPLISKPDEGAILLAGSVKVGDKFKFSVSPGFEVVDATVSEFAQLHQRQLNSADALILFSCKGRHASLGPLIEEEINGIYQTWNKPMIGFLAYGEIGCVKDGFCDFHNETCTLVSLRYKQ